MSARRKTIAAWVLVAVSLGCVAGLQYAVVAKLDRWDALPFALLAHGAMLPAVAAAGLTWKQGARSARTVSRLLAAIMIGVWVHTWFGPLQKVVAWLSIQWYLWLGV